MKWDRQAGRQAEEGSRQLQEVAKVCAFLRCIEP